jgi:predicted ATP-dependent endonuclease of OLD family
MKIEKVFIEKYKVFENFEIDFLDGNNNPLDVVVIAGINGSGKTSLLEFIYGVTSQDIREPKGLVFVDASSVKFEQQNLGKIILGTSGIIPKDFENKENIQTAQVKPFYFFIHDFVYRTKQNALDSDVQILHTQKTQQLYYFKAQDLQIQTLKNQIISFIESKIYDDGLSAKEAYKILRDFLNNVFEDMEMQISFKTLDKDKKIYFENSLGEQIEIDTLSTGEKELLSKVFYLYLANIQDSLILIDEPEISLHPSWQNRVVNIYKNFAKKNNCQIIIATHSPHIVASTSNESLRILAKEDNKIVAHNLNAYGMQIAKVLTQIMGVQELRPLDVQKKYDRVKNMILNNEYQTESFRKQFKELEEMMVNDSIDFGLLKLELLKREKHATSN